MNQTRARLAIWTAGLLLAVLLAAYLVPKIWRNVLPGAADTDAPLPSREAEIPRSPATTASSNAADSYLAAMQILQPIHQPPDVDQYLRYETKPFDDQASQLFAKYEQAAGLARLAKDLPACDWPEQSNETFGRLLNGNRMLTNFTLMHARFVHQKQHNPTLAMEEIFSVLTLGRRVGTMPRLTTKLVEVGIETQAGNALARLMPSLSPEQLKTIPDRLNGLPQSLTPTEVFLGELNGASGNNPGLMQKSLSDSTGQFYKDIEPAWQQSPDEFAKTVDSVGGKLILNPMIKTISPSMKSLRNNLAAEQATFAMLVTAAGILVRGDSAVAESRDPFGDGPFKYEKYPGSFNLTSKFQYKGKPLVLIVGGE
ncbi:MAG TPA: hypothetical protein VHD56_14030 [Tepidisphaeraceae bacterium]|nr:hypothetical protein [Tepidisphaeraceae bacterium]